MHTPVFSCNGIQPCVSSLWLHWKHCQKFECKLMFPTRKGWAKEEGDAVKTLVGRSDYRSPVPFLPSYASNCRSSPSAQSNLPTFIVTSFRSNRQCKEYRNRHRVKLSVSILSIDEEVRRFVGRMQDDRQLNSTKRVHSISNGIRRTSRSW